MNETLGFVILHHNTENETKNCVRSILQHVYGASIVVVDNGSTDGSGERLKEAYKRLPVEVLCLGENIGFARGNNAGIGWIRNNTKAKFILILNSDTLILQDDVEKIIEQEFNQSGFAVMGPQLITQDGDKGTNPVEQLVCTKRQAQQLILKRKIKLILNRLCLNGIVHDVGTKVKRKGLYDYSKRYENVKLHGACWILSPRYFDFFTGLCDRTFLYFEEDILFLQVNNKGLKTIYNPELQIIHLEDATVEQITKSNREKNIFVLRHEISSLKVLLRILEEMGI